MKPYYYVYKHGDKGPKVRHPDLPTAQNEAEQLAAKEPGISFEILRCVGITQTGKASTFWIEGEEPLHPLATMCPDWPGIDREEPPEKPRYRMMEEGEMFREGDQWQLESGKWLNRTAGFGVAFSTYRYNPHRRPL